MASGTPFPLSIAAFDIRFNNKKSFPLCPRLRDYMSFRHQLNLETEKMCHQRTNASKIVFNTGAMVFANPEDISFMTVQTGAFKFKVVGYCFSSLVYDRLSTSCLHWPILGHVCMTRLRQRQNC